MKLSKIIKQNAKHALSGVWGRAILTICICLLPSILINTLEYIIREMAGIPEFFDAASTPFFAFDDSFNLSILSCLLSFMIFFFDFLVTSPLKQGGTRWYYRRTGGETDTVSEVFYYFETMKDFLKSLWLHFCINIRLFFWALLFFTPPIACYVVYMFTLDANIPIPLELISLGWILMFFWVILSTVLLSILSLRYFLAPYLLVENPTDKVGKLIKQSVQLVRGHKGSLFLFGLSFILWFLPVILIFVLFFFFSAFYPMEFFSSAFLLLLIQFGILFYLSPYLHMSYAMYARYLIQLDSANSQENSTREYTAYKPEIDRYLEESQNLSDTQH